ncbi:hypothetical protein B9Z55_027406 [Caenorhabditis nigoni]|uniref:Uncharacterized protein n=1 Tax=Caenorhabditis nigoni TaxID=1611254 RepID=A0A2G5SFC7_9PELO|nr:hypothetical protein B9Z55_027406 [Caenorhabditis nigoni]
MAPKTPTRPRKPNNFQFQGHLMLPTPVPHHSNPPLRRHQKTGPTISKPSFSTLQSHTPLPRRLLNEY